MQAGRELDVKVAEALGWPITEMNGEWFVRVVTKFYEGQEALEPMPEFSTTWEGMGLLVEEARRQGILIDLETWPDFYEARAADVSHLVKVEGKTASSTTCLAFLKFKGIEV